MKIIMVLCAVIVLASLSRRFWRRVSAWREDRASSSNRSEGAPLAADKQFVGEMTDCPGGQLRFRPGSLLQVQVDSQVVDDRVHIVSRVTCEGKTGVEMEAMTAAVAALIVYDMVKSTGKGVEVGPVRLLQKQDGKSDHWKREESSDGAG